MAETNEVALRAFQDTGALVPPQILHQLMLPIPRADRSHRQRFGRAISMARIESALIASYRGQMQDITDISRETIDTDPHLGAVLSKRFGALSQLPWEVVPASGEGIDEERAEFYAEVVRTQIKSLKSFRQSLMQLAWGLFDGRSALEIHWGDVVGGAGMSSPRFGSVTSVVDALAWIHPRRLSFGPHRELRVVDEIRGFRGADFAPVGFDLSSVPQKFICGLPQLFGEYPEREGLAPRCLYWSFFKRFGARERMILLELYGKPWKIMELDPASNASTEDLDDADEIVDALGASFTARLPRGVKLNTVSPDKAAGENHEAVIVQTDKQLSKLVLGQTGTTDGVPAGIGGTVANVMHDEQMLILARDAGWLDELVETDLTDVIISVNFGPEAVTHAPGFVMRPEPPLDRKAELERLKFALEAGLEVSLSEAYEMSGYRVPEEDEAVLRFDDPETAPGALSPPAARPIIVRPIQDEVEDQAEQVAEIADLVRCSVRQDRNKWIVHTKDGSQQIGIFDSLEEAREFEAEIERIEREAFARREGQRVESRIRDNLVRSSVPRHIAASLANSARVDAEEEATLAISLEGCTHCLQEDHRQPETAEGTIEDLVDRAVEDSEAVLQEWANAFAESVRDMQEPMTIFNALTRAHERIALVDLAESLTPNVQQSMALGGIDAENQTRVQALPDAPVGDSPPPRVDATAENSCIRLAKDDHTHTVPGGVTSADPLGPGHTHTLPDGGVTGPPIAVPDSDDPTAHIHDIPGEGVTGPTQDLELSRQPGHVLLIDEPPFSKTPFTRAMEIFKARNVVTRPQFDRLSALARQRSFTVSGILSERMLRLTHAELVRQIGKGADLREFETFVRERLETAGFVKPAPGGIGTQSHVRTVFRTNTLAAYNAGRHAQMTNPRVLAARPIWEIRTVRDNRVRAGHRSAHGVRLPATDPFWRTAFPPFGFNCRCRVRSRPADVRGVTNGADPRLRRLPDPGFSSGTTTLLADSALR